MSGLDPANHAGRWLQYAWEDLAMAELVEASTQLAPRIACFQSQQAVEKAIKGALTFLGIAFPRTHDIETLFELMPNDWQIRSAFPDLPELSQWAIEARYPGDWPDATPEDAREAVKLARAVVESIEHDLIQHGFTLE